MTMGAKNKTQLANSSLSKPIEEHKLQPTASRIFVRAKNRVTYNDNSDSDEDISPQTNSNEVTQPQVKKRVLPNWLIRITNPLQATKNDETVPPATKSPPTMKQHIRLLREKFNHKGFHIKQWQIIQTLIIERRDVVGVMATGYGKSLCFQYPGVYLEGITLVVSPLIALMQDQVMDLEARGISACLLGSAQADRTMPRRIATGEFCLVYASPEFLNSPSGEYLLRKIESQLRLIAIDEAHCVSQWGLEFRPDYRELGRLRAVIPDVPILALTATATEDVRRDIATVLNLNEPKIIVSSFDRPNLEFAIYKKTLSSQWSPINRFCYNYWKDLKPILRNSEGSKIIYVLTRAETEIIAGILREQKIVCAHYHAGMKIKERDEILRKFRSDEIKVVVATIAFGMGIDKRDVRYVIHYGATSTLEKYYQEVGRAGRDGQPSKAITFLSTADFRTHDWFLTQEKTSEEYKHYLAGLQRKMRNFLCSTHCRRRQILEYFGQDPNSIAARPNCCDNCSLGLNGRRLSDLFVGVNDDGIYDSGSWARDLLLAISSKSEGSKLTIVGDLEKKICRESETRIPYFWDAVVEQLRHSGYLIVKYVPIDDAKHKAVLELTDIGKKFVRSRSRELKLKAIGLMYAFLTKKCYTSIVNVPNQPGHGADSGEELKPNILSIKSKSKPDADAIDWDSFFANHFNDYNFEEEERLNLKEENSDGNDDNAVLVASNDSDVIFVENTVDPIIAISGDEDDELEAKRTKMQ